MLRDYFVHVCHGPFCLLFLIWGYIAYFFVNLFFSTVCVYYGTDVDYIWFGFASAFNQKLNWMINSHLKKYF